jgi:uncharacterized protein YkwD
MSTRLRSTIVCMTITAVLPCMFAAGGSSDRVVNSLLKAHNRERRLKELEPLTLSPQLCEAAYRHARDLAVHRMIGHTGSDGSTAAERVKRAGYVAARAGENCAEGQWTVGEVMTGWMKSPGHRANILARYTEMGAGWARDEDGTIYWCVDFGTPRSGAKKTPRKPDDIATAVVKQINRDRQSGRLVLLQPESSLSTAAMALSATMAAQDRLETEDDALKQIDKKTTAGRELQIKVCANVATPERAAALLEADDADRRSRFREIGVGYAVSKNGTPYWCALFATPSIRPFDDPTDKQSLAYPSAEPAWRKTHNQVCFTAKRPAGAGEGTARSSAPAATPRAAAPGTIKTRMPITQSSRP